MTHRFKSLWRGRLPLIPALLICLGTGAPFEPRLPDSAMPFPADVLPPDSEPAGSGPIGSGPIETQETSESEPVGSSDGKYGWASVFAGRPDKSRGADSFAGARTAVARLSTRPCGAPSRTHRAFDLRNGIGAPLRC